MIHHTVGVYNDGSRKTNGVTSENLAGHIKYNLTLRPGRAFFVDGYCLNEGYLSHARCKEIEKELQEAAFRPPRDTAPYQ